MALFLMGVGSEPLNVLSYDDVFAEAMHLLKPIKVYHDPRAHNYRAHTHTQI